MESWGLCFESDLNQTKSQMEHVWALDADPFATEIYAKTHHCQLMM